VLADHPTPTDFESLRAGLVPLAQEPRSHITTFEAARHLNRAQQTLRMWASSDSGPLRPIRVSGRLAWPVADLRRLLSQSDAIK
jgi:hypothetical protein